MALQWSHYKKVQWCYRIMRTHQTGSDDFKTLLMQLWATGTTRACDGVNLLDRFVFYNPEKCQPAEFQWRILAPRDRLKAQKILWISGENTADQRKNNKPSLGQFVLCRCTGGRSAGLCSLAASEDMLIITSRQHPALSLGHWKAG